MKNLVFGILVILFTSAVGFAQSTFYFKPEVGYTRFLEHAVQIEPGPNWRGYYIESQNAVTVSAVGGVCLRNRFAAGLGLGYQNFEGNSGVSLYADLEFYLTRLKFYEGTEEQPAISMIKPSIRPLVYVRVGGNQLWNQYEGGTQSGVGEIGVGFEYNFQQGYCLYVKGGMAVMQQSFLAPFGVGMRF
jgi:hypothetical protein